MHLTVEPGNDQAIRVYERSGWRRKETPSQPWNGAMFKELV
jgi:hypothetical protein